ncbi:MAG: right-handed parallel beta-helix repeat-containing protein, partial [bacterium]
MDFKEIDMRKYTIFTLLLLTLIVDFPSPVFSSGIIIKRNEIYANNMVGIRNIGSKVVVQDTHIYNNGRAGVLVLDGTDDTLIDQCVIAYNNKTGVDINNSGKTSITSSSIHHNNTAGIQIAPIETGSHSIIKGTCYVDIRESHIYKNDKSGIRGGFSDSVEHTLVLAVHDCNIEKNKKSGISIKNNTILIASGNKISLNGMAGITSVELENELANVLPGIDIVRNIIDENDNCGINAQYAHMNNNGIRNNLILNNGNSGIRCQSLPMVIANNTIVGNGNKYQGVGIEHLDEQKAPYIINNIIAYTHITGIKIP